MLFQIVQPFAVDIYGDSFKEAIKNYVKLNYAANITNMIIKDQANHYQTRVRYYKENNKNKVGIDVYPYTNMSYPIIQPLQFAQQPPQPLPFAQQHGQIVQQSPFPQPVQIVQQPSFGQPFPQPVQQPRQIIQGPQIVQTSIPITFVPNF